MKNLKAILNVLIFLEIVIQLAAITIYICQEAYTDAILQVIQAAVICVPLFIIKSIVDEILELKTKYSRVEKNIEFELRRLSKTNIQNILKAEKLPGRIIKVFGKRTYDESTGFECPLCGYYNKADCTRCKHCDSTVEYEEQ